MAQKMTRILTLSRGDEDDRHAGINPADPLKTVQPRSIGQMQIQQHNIRRVSSHLPESSSDEAVHRAWIVGRVVVASQNRTSARIIATPRQRRALPKSGLSGFATWLQRHRHRQHQLAPAAKTKENWIDHTQRGRHFGLPEVAREPTNCPFTYSRSCEPS
jgi:hypothetical protein